MEKELYELQEKLTEFVNKHDVKCLKIDILKYYDTKKVFVNLER